MPSVLELKKMCRNKGIQGYSKLNKKELQNLVKVASSKRASNRRSFAFLEDYYTVEIILQYVRTRQNEPQPTVQQIKKFMKDNSVNFLEEHLLEYTLNGMPDLSAYYDFKYDSGMISFKIPKDITDNEGNPLTIEDTVRLISELSEALILQGHDELSIRDNYDDEMGYISFSDVRFRFSDVRFH